MCCCSKHGSGSHIEVSISCGESPHVVRCATSFPIGRHLIRLERRVILQSICDGSCISQVMIVVEHRVRERRSHVPYLFCLCHQIERAVFYILQHVWLAVRPVQIHIPLFLTHKGFISLRLKELPRTNEVLLHLNIRACLDVKVTRIKVATHIQPWNMLQRLIFRVSSRSLTVQIEMVTQGCLKITLLEWISMPHTIALIHIHVIHVDRHPHISRSIRNLVIHPFIYHEVVGLGRVILDEIEPRLFHFREVKVHRVIFIIVAPTLQFTLKHLALSAILIDTHQRGSLLWCCLLVKFYHAHLRLLRHITHLREPYVRLVVSWQPIYRRYARIVRVPTASLTSVAVAKV